MRPTVAERPSMRSIRAGDRYEEFRDGSLGYLILEQLEFALVERDREVRAKALEDASDDIEFRAGKWMAHGNQMMRSNGEAEASWWLVTRAAAIRGGR